VTSADDSAASRASSSALVVASVPGVAAGKWARIWNERFPHVPLELRDIPEDGVAAALADDAPVHLCFARTADGESAEIGAGLGPGLNAVRLWSEVPVVVASRDHAIKVVETVTLAELDAENLIDGDDEATLDLVATGVGVARMPQSVFRLASRRDLVARPVSDAHSTRIALVWSAGLPAEREEQVQEFIGIVRGRGEQSSRSDAPKAPIETKKERAEKAAKAARAAKQSRASGGKSGAKGSGARRPSSSKPGTKRTGQRRTGR